MITNYERGLIMLLCILALFASFFFLENFNLNQEIKKKANVIESQNIEEKKEEEEYKKIEEIKNKINNLEIEAKAISIYNTTTNQKIFGKNDEIAMPLASLAKTMTVIFSLDNNYTEDVFISPDAIKEFGDNELMPNEKWKVTDLAKFTLILSSNDAAMALSQNDKEFINKMNNKAKEIGMDKALFLNSTGLDLDQNKAGALGTSFDANILAIYALKTYPEIFKITTLSNLELKSLSDFTHKIKNTNIIINKIPNLLFSKTGFTELAGGNLTVIFKDKIGDEIAISLLGSTMLGRFSDMEKIVNLLYNFNVDQ